MRIPYSSSVVLLFSSCGIHIKSGSKNIYIILYGSTIRWHMEYYNGYFNFISYFSYFSHKELWGCDIILFQSAVTSSAMFGKCRVSSRYFVSIRSWRTYELRYISISCYHSAVFGNCRALSRYFVSIRL